VGPFGLGYGALDDMINLPIVTFELSLGIKIGVGTSDDCEDCAMGGEGIRFLRRLLSLWRWWVGFDLDLRIGVIWH
jgi:hypothetical protein